jgi:glycosyltransferase involved in cell wall biosynthesis
VEFSRGVWESSVVDAFPLVTVFMPVYNGEKYLRNAIDSVLNQVFRDFELLIINDASIDGTAEILCEYAQQDKRIIVHHHQSNKGLIATLNRGLQLARGKFIARIDQDDMMVPNRLKEQVLVLESRKNVAVVGSWIEVINEEGLYLTKWELPYTNRDCDFSSFLNGDTPVGHPCVMYRADVIRSHGGYRAEYIHAEDVDLWFRVELAGQAIVNIPKILTSYRLHDGQTTALFRDVSESSRYNAFAYYLSNKLSCAIEVETAASMIPENFTERCYQQQIQLDEMYKLKFQMFQMFSHKHKLTLKETHKYAYKVWKSFIPLCRLRFTNPFKVIYQNTICYLRLMNTNI